MAINIFHMGHVLASQPASQPAKRLNWHGTLITALQEGKRSIEQPSTFGKSQPSLTVIPWRVGRPGMHHRQKTA